MSTLPKVVGAMTIAVAVIASVVGQVGAQESYLGEVITFAGTFCPDGYRSADGSLLPIAGNEELFALIGTTYGGDGQSTVGLPNLVGATALGTGEGAGLPAIVLGQTGGTANTVGVQDATAKSVQVPATQSPSLSLARCVAVVGVFPPRE
jgi:microcystin-dependent protein